MIRDSKLSRSVRGHPSLMLRIVPQRAPLGLRGLMIVLPLGGSLACSGGSPQIAGRYVSISDTSEYIELHPSGGFYLKELGVGWFGKYSVEENIVTIKLKAGMANRATLRGDTLFDDEGGSWVRQ